MLVGQLFVLFIQLLGWVGSMWFLFFIVGYFIWQVLEMYYRYNLVILGLCFDFQVCFSLGRIYLFFFIINIKVYLCYLLGEGDCVNGFGFFNLDFYFWFQVSKGSWFLVVGFFEFYLIVMFKLEGLKQQLFESLWIVLLQI